VAQFGSAHGSGP